MLARAWASSGAEEEQTLVFNKKVLHASVTFLEVHCLFWFSPGKASARGCGSCSSRAESPVGRRSSQKCFISPRFLVSCGKRRGERLLQPLFSSGGGRRKIPEGWKDLTRG